MGSTFSRLKNWIAEVLNYSDLNAEIDNILNNLTPAGMGVQGLSDTVTAFRVQTDPGEVGTESLPASLQQEIQRLRFVIQEMKGGDVTYWYQSAQVSLTTLRTAIGGALQSNRISSGAASSLSSAARFVIPAGSSASFTIDGSPTTLAYVVNNVSYAISTDVVTSGIGLAPSTNNTCLVNDTSLTAQERSKNTGEDGSILTVDNMGSEISALTGKLASFKVVHGGNTEYFLGYVKSSTQITNCFRGFFYDSAKAQLPRIAIADDDTITLMRTAWIFANTSQAIVLTYNNPIWAFTQPTSPNTGDYWFDLSVNYWKTFDSVTWQTANAILIGLTCQDATNCKGARSFEFFSLPVTVNNIRIDYVSVTQVQQLDLLGNIGVGSNNIKFTLTRPIWDITTNLESGYSEAASTTYYAYVTEAGKTILSPLKPYDFTGSLGGWYHPYEIWRSVGSIQNDGSQNFDILTLMTYPQDIRNPKSFEANHLENIGITASVAANALTVKFSAADGTDLSPGNPAYVAFRSSTATAGTVVLRRLFANISITVPNTSSLGSQSTYPERYFLYLIDDAGVIDGGISGVTPIDEVYVQSATALTGGLNSGGSLCSGLAHTSKPVRYVGFMRATEATAGTWATAPSEVSVGVRPFIAHWAVARVIVNFTTVTTTAIQGFSHGVSSLTDVAVGRTTVNPSAAFNSAFYTIVATSSRTVDGTCCIYASSLPTDSSFTIQTGNGAGGAEDQAYVSVAAFGDSSV